MLQATDDRFEARRLQSCLNDMIGVLALPALWHGRPAQVIMSALLDGLVKVQRLDLASITLSVPIDGAPGELVRRRPSVAAESGLCSACFRLGLGDEIGVLTASSSRADFPTPTEALLLQVAASQAAIGLQEARRACEQEHAAKELERRVQERTAELHALKEELAADVLAMTRLQELGARLLAKTSLEDVLSEVLDGTIALQNADFGNVQLYDDGQQALELLAHRGFDAEFKEPFRYVRPDMLTSCGRALAGGTRVIVEDVDTDPLCEGLRTSAAAAGFRAQQSTPLFSRSGQLLGMLTTHFRVPHRSSERELRLTDLYAHLAAELIERKQSEAALLAAKDEAERRAREAEAAQSVFRAVLEYAPGGITITNGPPDYRIVATSKHAAALIGKPIEQLVDIPAGRHAEQYGLRMQDGSRPRPEQVPLYRASRHGEVVKDEEWLIERPDGSRITVLTNVAPFHDSHGQVIGAINCWRDITDRKHDEEALRRAQDELAHVSRVTTLGELASSIAHEVNQPLAAITTNAQACTRWLAAQPPDLDEARATLKHILRDANRAAEVVVRIRAFVRRSATCRTPVDVLDAISEVVALILDRARHHAVAVTVAPAAVRPPMVLSDKVQLQQVLLNLAINAIEAMSQIRERPRVLEFAVHERAPDVLIAVRDSGPGLPSESRERIFEPFRTTKPDGMGMGLAISRSIVEAHGGTLWATPNAPYGECFQFTLPASNGKVEA